MGTAKYLYGLLNGRRVHVSEVASGTVVDSLFGDAKLRAYHGESGRIWHFKLISGVDPDPWHEGKTQWHIDRQNLFPKECQEVVREDFFGDPAHIADVCVRNFVVEFQHSYMSPEERRERELFYQNMFWVVDGDRTKTGYKRFLEDGRKSVRQITLNGVQVRFVFGPRCVFPYEWVESAVPVFFDFRKQPVWYCLLPGRVDNAAVCLKMRRDQFVSIVNGNPFKWIQQQKKMMDGLCKWAKAEGKSAFEKMEIDVGMSYASMWMS